MARFKRMQVLNCMAEQGLVPVFYHPDIALVRDIAKACYAGGARCLELTNRGDNAVDLFKQLEIYCREALPEMILGVGSIVDAPTAALYIAAGANFIVGPLIDEETAILCNKRKIPYMPGCGSATEIHRAEALGVEICKIFPGSQVGGPEFVKAVKGPCPWSSLMPTGGVNPTRQSLEDWFLAGITCAGIGSQLITREIISGRHFKELEAKVREVLSIISELKGPRG